MKTRIFLNQPSQISFVKISLGVLFLLATPLIVQGEGAEDGQQFFREKVYPILKEHCVKCHGGEKIKGGLVLTSRDGFLKGGENGVPLDASTPAKSLLLDMMSYRDGDHEMPPAGKRPDSELAVFQKWLALGAPYDPALESAPKIAVAPKAPAPTENAANWWAYQPVRELAAPTVARADWARNPVDAFLLQSMRQAGLQPNPRASKAQLVRRAYYDLIGLPPTPEEVKRFEQDSSLEAWPRLIESLLAKPQYGEKWARHWMDIVRYAETEGFERDSEKPHIWRYRDYLIEAFNADLPYDQFLTQQLAGDEVQTPTQQSLTATGFLRLMQFDDEPSDRLQAKYDLLADNVQVTAETFLGMTMGCARCHDHKKDPITQKDYYSFMSFFHGLKEYGGTRNSPLAWVAPEQKTNLREQKRQTLTRLDEAYQKSAPSLLAGYEKNVIAGGKSPLVEAKAGSENAWIHTATNPGPNWRAENFAAKDWETTPETKATAGQTIWMRARFGLATLPKNLCIDLEYGGDTEVFLNGTSVFNASDLPHGSRFLELSRHSKLLHTGSNLLTVKGSVSSDGRLLRVRLFGDKSPLLQEPKRDDLAGLKKGEGADALPRLKQNSEAWLAEAERPIGVMLSAVSENGSAPAPLAVHRRGSPQNLGEPVEAAFPAVFSGSVESKPAEVKPIGQSSSGRRLALARWMIQPENPLVSRVEVNRLWQHHFGRGIVQTPNDFGRLGELPSHPELLDFLARTFVQKGWSIKAMHRLLMNSEAYQMSSAASPDSLAKDPENLHWWRFPMRRLTAEEVRDSILSVSGMLKLDAFGPPVHPPLPKEVLETQSVPGKGWPKESVEATARRSVYVHVKRSLSLPLLADHDQAATDSPCAVRFVSTVPTQALGMLNSEFMADQALRFAQRLQHEAGLSPEAQIRRGLQLVLQRDPAQSELALCLKTLQQFQSELNLPPELALQRLTLLALNLNEFLYLD